jgi:hypothetical protein
MKNLLKLLVIFLLVMISNNMTGQTLEMLTVGGGGGGGRNGNSNSSGGGGGSGGQVAYYSTTYSAGQTYTIVVGAGGSGYNTTGPTNPVNGSASTITYSSTVWSAAGGNLGGNASSTSASGAGGTSPGGSGNGGNGGIKTSSTMPQSGANGNTTYSGWCSITGTGHNVSGTYYLASGGNGGNYQGSPSGAAASNGGGGLSNTSGTANTGGGGGGANSNTSSGYNINGGSGGSGLVIIRYSGTAVATGGTITTSGGYTYHAFTSGGTLQFNSIISAHPSTSTQNVCINGTTTALSVAVSGTSITYQWYSNTTSSNSGGTLISGATSSTYTPPSNVAGTKYYYCYVTNSTSNGTSNVSGDVNITTPSVAGTVSGGNTITAGVNSTVLTISGHNGTPQWQSSTDDITFSNLSGQTGSTYTAVNLSSTTYYRAVVTSGGCASATSNSTTVLVLPGSSPGSTTLSVTGTGTTISMANNVSTVVDAGVTVTANGQIGGFAVAITASYTSGDVLSYTGTLPSGVTTSGFNTTSRSIVFNGSATAAAWQALLRTVTLQTTAVTCNPESRAVSFTPSTNYYNYFNGHYYEYASAGRSWTDAKAYAESLNFFGRQGYLTTISSAAENAYITTLINENTWIGCSDNYLQINAAVGYTKYANQTSAEGKWHWVSGPEKGKQIRTGNASTAEKAGSPVSGVYQNWNTTGSYSSNEPNDVWSTSKAGEEDYGHVYAGTGKWNDFPNGGRACIIEYGDMPGDNPVTTIAYTRNISITGSTPGRITGAGGTVCSGSNSTTLTLSGASGTVARWEFSDDNFLSNITTISNTTTSYSAVNISNSTYYRAIMVNGGCTLATPSVALTVTPLSGGAITSVSNKVCATGNAILTLNGYSGTISKWQISPNMVSTTDIASTSNQLSQAMPSAGTYYFRAVVDNSTCATTVNSDWYPVDVSSGNTPVGGTVNSAAYCSATNSGVLSLSGAAGATFLWQVSTDNGGSWSSAGSTLTTLTYNNISQNKLYRVQVSNGSCGTVNSATGEIVIYGTTICEWTGAVNGVWSNAANWCAGVVGNNGRRVHINALSANDPVLDGTVNISELKFNASARKVTLGTFNMTADLILQSDSMNYVKTNSTGVLRSTIPNSGQFTFAVGNSAYNPVRITNNTGTSDLFSVRVIDAVYYQGTYGYPSVLSRINRTWDISKASANGGIGIDYLFSWNYAEAINLPSGHRLNHFENGAWTPQTAGVTTVVDNTLSYTGYLGTFSPFGIGPAAVALPVHLFDFDTKVTGNTVTLNWTVQADEMHHFDISRSADGIHWVNIGQINGSADFNGVKQHRFVDQDPMAFNYYKITMVGHSTQKTSSLVRTARLAQIVVKPTVVPNPNTGNFVLETTVPCNFQIMDINGRIVKSGTFDHTFPIDNLDKGIYSIFLKSEDSMDIVKVIVQ